MTKILLGSRETQPQINVFRGVTKDLVNRIFIVVYNFIPSVGGRWAPFLI